jgi:hypothetical protein
MKKYIEATKIDKELEKKEREEIDTFLEEPEVKELFEQYDKPLFSMYKFYAAQEIKKDETYELDYLNETISF